MIGPGDGYEWALARITEKDVDLANAVSALKRSHDDNDALLANQTDLVGAYKRLQEHHERLRHQFHREQEERHLEVEEYQRQIAHLRSQLGAKSRDVEELQGQRLGPPDILSIRSQLEEEIAEPFRRQVYELQTQLSVEQERAAEARRQMEMRRLDHKHKEQETREQAAEQAQRHGTREQALQRQISTLEAELRTQTDAAAAVGHLRTQMQEQEAKLLGLQKALQEQERCSEVARKALADEISQRSEELSVARRRLHESQAELLSQERLHEQKVAECETRGREQARSAAQLAEAKAQLAIMRPAEDSEQLREEITQVRRTMASECEQLTRRATSSEEQLRASRLAVKQLETQVRQSEDDRAERDREFQTEQEESDRKHMAEVSALRAEMEKNSREAEARRLAIASANKALTRQLEDAKSQAEVMRDEAEQGSQEEAERRIKECQRDHQQRAKAALEEHQKEMSTLQIEMNALRLRADLLESERDENATAAQAARAAAQAQAQRADALQVDVAALLGRLDTERNNWVRDADEAQAAAIRLEEERRNSATLQLTEDHKRQVAKLHTAYKKGMQKASRKRQETKQRCQELAKRVMQLQQEKAATGRLADETKTSYEMRLAELGLVSRLGLGSISVGAADVIGVNPPAVLRTDLGVGDSGSLHKRELRAIMERLEQNAEKLPGTLDTQVTSLGQCGAPQSERELAALEMQPQALPAPAKEKRLLGFDFDCTLTVKHFYKCFCWGYAQGNRNGHEHCGTFFDWCSQHGVHTERHQMPNAQRDADPMGLSLDTFCRNAGEEAFRQLFREVFLGGEERIQMVAQWLESMSEGGVEFAIVTAGVATSVLRALTAVPEWLKFFPSSRIWDSSQSRHKVRSVMAAKVLILRDICPESIKTILIDDSLVKDRPPDWVSDGGDVEVVGLPYEGPGVDKAYLDNIGQRLLSTEDESVSS